MIKVPAYQCSFKHHTTTCTRNVGKHEIPLLRMHARKMGGGDLEVKRPEPGQSPEMYWVTFESVEAEYSRLRNPDGMYGPYKYSDREDIVSRQYPTVEDMAQVVDEELEKLAGNGGKNPNLPKQMKAPQDLMDLATKALGPAFAEKEGPEQYALALVAVGITSVPELATASMSKLCSAALIGASAAQKLKAAANEQEDLSAAQDAKKGPIEGLKMFDEEKAKDPADLPVPAQFKTLLDA